MKTVRYEPDLMEWPEPHSFAEARAAEPEAPPEQKLAQQAAWLDGWESKHGNPGDPGYRILHPNTRVPDRPGTPKGVLARDVAARAKSPAKPTAKPAKPTAKPKARTAKPSVGPAPKKDKRPKGVKPRPTVSGMPRSAEVTSVVYGPGGKIRATRVKTRWYVTDDVRAEPELSVNRESPFFNGFSFSSAEKKAFGPAPEGLRWEFDSVFTRAWHLRPIDGTEADRIGAGYEPESDPRKVTDAEIESFVEILDGVQNPQGIEGMQAETRLKQEHPILAGAVIAWVRENLSGDEIAAALGFSGKSERNTEAIGKIHGKARPHAKALAKAITSGPRSTETLYRSYAVPGIGDGSEFDREVEAEAGIVTKPGDSFKVGSKVVIPVASASRSEAFALNWTGLSPRESQVIFRIPPGTQHLNIEALNDSQFEHLVSGKFTVAAVEVIDGITYVDLKHTGDFSVDD